MNHVLFKTAVPAALALILAGCGGGDDEGFFVEDRDPFASGLAATVNVAAPANPALNGVYASNNIFLNNVTKPERVGAVETCRFRFSDLAQQVAGANRLMDGDIRYVAGTNSLDSTVVSINTIEFRLLGTPGATVDKANNRVVYDGAVLTSTQNTGQTITLTGAIPMRGNRPEGC